MTAPDSRNFINDLREIRIAAGLVHVLSQWEVGSDNKARQIFHVGRQFLFLLAAVWSISTHVEHRKGLVISVGHRPSRNAFGRGDARGNVEEHRAYFFRPQLTTGLGLLSKAAEGDRPPFIALTLRSWLLYTY